MGSGIEDDNPLRGGLRVKRMAADGSSVIIVSSELSELMQVCDTIEVMFDGRRVASFTGDEIDESAILKYAIAGRA